MSRPAAGRTASGLPELSRRLQQLRDASGKSYSRLERDTGLTAAYIWRLENGERHNPTRDVLVMIALGLSLERDQVAAVLQTADTLLDSAGYGPMLRLPRLTDEQLNDPKGYVAATEQ